MTVLSVSNAKKKFPQKSKSIVALDGVSLEIEKGQIIGLLGPNGAGKTTLISAICGLVTLDGGTILVNGMDATNRNAVSGQINVVTGFAGLLNDLSVEDLLMYYSMMYNVGDKKNAIDRALARAALSDKRDQIANTLSSGYRQRFYIAKALLSNPSLILLDEPTVGLDVFSARALRNIVRELRAQGLAILLTTHYMAEAEELCDFIHLISKGKIIASGSAAELKKKAGRDKNASLEDAFVALANERLGQEDEP